MGRIDQELDRLRLAKAAAHLAGPGLRGTDRLPSVGAPPTLTPGSRVVDPVTGEEGEVVGYTRPAAQPAPLTP